MTEVTAPATGQGATEIGSSPAPGQGAAPAADTSVSWLSGANEDTIGYVTNKGWKAPTDIVEGYRNLEKYVGVPQDKLLRLPDWNKADKVELDQFYNKLGRPADPKGYELPLPEGDSGEFADWAKGIFHESGLTATQAKNIAAKWNEYQNSQAQKVNEIGQQKFQEQESTLKREWGQAFEQEVGFAKKAAKGLGLQEAQIDALQSVLGFDGLMKMMNSIGRKLGEDNFVSGGPSGDGPMTPANAKAKIQALKGDKDWVQKYLSGNIDARKEMERLQMMAVG